MEGARPPCGVTKVGAHALSRPRPTTRSWGPRKAPGTEVLRAPALHLQAAWLEGREGLAVLCAMHHGQESIILCGCGKPEQEGQWAQRA